MKQLNEKPWMTALLVIINLIFFVAELYIIYRLSGETRFNQDQSQVMAALYLGAENKVLVFQAHQYWRLILSSFIHFGLMHLLTNMVFLYAIGRITEQIIGHFRYLLLYLISGFTGNIIALLLSQNEWTVTAGASGSLFGYLGFWTVVWLKYRHHKNFILDDYGKEMFTLAVANIILNFFMQGVSITGHVGGFVGGFIFALMMLQWFKPRAIRQAEYLSKSS